MNEQDVRREIGESIREPVALINGFASMMLQGDLSYAAAGPMIMAAVKELNRRLQALVDNGR